MYGTLSCRISRRVARVLLNRPAQRNALSTEVMRELIQCAGDLSVRDDVDVVIVTGRGGCFSAGADLKDARRWANDSATLVQRREIAFLGLRMARAWEELPQISIAAREAFLLNRARTTAARTRVGVDPRESDGPRRDPVPRPVPARRTTAAAVRAPRRARRPPGTDS